MAVSCVTVAPRVLATTADQDSTWNGGSPALITYPNEVHPVAQVVASDNSVYVVGVHVSSIGTGPSVTTLDGSGALAAAFGTGGTVDLLPAGGISNVINPSDAAVQPTTSRLVVAGKRASQNQWVVARVNDTGQLDTSFSADGQRYIGPVNGLNTYGFPFIAALVGGGLVLAGDVADATNDVTLMTARSDGAVSILVDRATGDWSIPQIAVHRYRPVTTPAMPSFSALASPHRLLDTRGGLGAPRGKVAAAGFVSLAVAGQAGVPVDAVAVALNVTVTDPDLAGYVTVFPCGQDPPLASNLNFVRGQTIPNLAIARIGTGGAVCILTSAPANLLADVTGWYGPTTDLRPLPKPTRVIDTRVALGNERNTATNAFVPSGTKVGGDIVAVLAPTSLADPYISELVLNVTVTEPVASGYITVYQCDQPRPLASNLNYVAGETIANAVLARTIATTAPPPAGNVCFYASSPTHLIVDIEAYLDVGAAERVLAAPSRVLDTRTGNGSSLGRLTAGTVLSLHVAGVAGIAADAPAVALNVTVTNPDIAGFVTVFPCGGAPPLASNLNFGPAQTIPNLVISRIGTGGNVCFVSNATVDLVADVAAWYPAVQ